MTPQQDWHVRQALLHAYSGIKSRRGVYICLSLPNWMARDLKLALQSWIEELLEGRMSLGGLAEVQGLRYR